MCFDCGKLIQYFQNFWYCCDSRVIVESDFLYNHISIGFVDDKLQTYQINSISF